MIFIHDLNHDRPFSRPKRGATCVAYVVRLWLLRDHLPINWDHSCLPGGRSQKYCIKEINFKTWVKFKSSLMDLHKKRNKDSVKGWDGQTWHPVSHAASLLSFASRRKAACQAERRTWERKDKMPFFSDQTWEFVVCRGERELCRSEIKVYCSTTQLTQPMAEFSILSSDFIKGSIIPWDVLFWCLTQGFNDLSFWYSVVGLAQKFVAFQSNAAHV